MPTFLIILSATCGVMAVITALTGSALGYINVKDGTPVKYYFYKGFYNASILFALWALYALLWSV